MPSGVGKNENPLLGLPENVSAHANLKEAGQLTKVLDR
jgi:hypothetical protein